MQGRELLGHAMLPSTVVGPGRAGVYFELYGMEEGQPVELTLSVERTDRSLLGRIGGFFGLGEASALSVAWTEVADRAEEPGYLPRFTEVDFSGLDAGTYRLVIGVSADDELTFSTSVPVTVRGDP